MGYARSKYKSHLSYSVSDGVIQNGGGSYTPFGQTQAYKDGVGLAFPVTAPFILAYGVLDYTFDIGDKLDKEVGEFNTHLYD